MGQPLEEKITLDLNTIAQLLQSRNEMYILRANIKSGIPGLGMKGPCQLYLRLHHGKLIDCEIVNRQQKLSGLQLERYLPYEERLTWSLTPTEVELNSSLHTPVTPPLPFSGSQISPINQLSPSQSYPGDLNLDTGRLDQDYFYAPPAATPSFSQDISVLIPHRLPMAERPEILHSLSRDLRRVLALVDGSRSVEKIAYVLRLPIEQTFKILQELQVKSLIE